MDVERAKTESPFGTTIAHGNLTLSMIDGFRSGLMESTGFKMGVNYGWNKVRFPAPVPAGSSIRASVEILSVDEVGGGWYQVAQNWTVEVEGTRSPPAWPSRCVRLLGARAARSGGPILESEAAGQPTGHPRPSTDENKPHGAAPRAARRAPASTCSATPSARSSTWARRARSASAWRATSPSRAACARWSSHVRDIEFIATETEAEALLAEQEFIKRHRPVYNVRLRDDKSYPYIGISLDEDYPRIYFTRERHRRNRVYFGPFSNAKRVRETLDLLGKVFQYRTCDGPEPGRASGSPCLDYFIKRCQAPCVGYISKEEYRENVDTIIDFLSGRYRQIERALDQGMKKAAAGAGVRAGGNPAQPPQGRPLAARAPAHRQRGGRHARRDRRGGRGAPTPTPRCSRSATACSRIARASISRTRPGATRARWPRSSCSSTTRARLRCRRR